MAKLNVKTGMIVEVRGGDKYELVEKPKNCCGQRFIGIKVGGPMFEEYIKTSDIIRIIK